MKVLYEYELVHQVIHTGLFTIMIYRCILYISVYRIVHNVMLCIDWVYSWWIQTSLIMMFCYLYTQDWSWRDPCIRTGLFTMLSPSISSSQASPIPSKSTSSCPLFGTSRQLSYNRLQQLLYIVWKTCMTLRNIFSFLVTYRSLLVTLLYHLLTLLHRNSLQRSSMLGTPSKSLSLAQYLPLPAYPILHCIFHKKLLTRNTS